MTCSRCPHHVRHGKFSADQKKVTFRDHCGLKFKQSQETQPQVKKKGPKPAATKDPDLTKTEFVLSAATECIHVPFPSNFEYFACEVYQKTFESHGLKNGVVPTKDFQFSEKLVGTSVTDMELL